MILHNDIPLLVNGTEVRADVEEYSRNGSKSPSLDIIILNGKRITPFQAKKLNIIWTYLSLFHYAYSDTIEDLVYSSNPFLDLIRTLSSNYFHPVILGVEHGIYFDT